jgi:hypothetical protein
LKLVRALRQRNTGVFLAVFAKILEAEGRQRSQPISLNVLARIFIRLANADKHCRASSIRFFSDTAAIDKFHHTFSGSLSLRKLPVFAFDQRRNSNSNSSSRPDRPPLSGPAGMLV